MVLPCGIIAEGINIPIIIEWGKKTSKKSPMRHYKGSIESYPKPLRLDLDLQLLLYQKSSKPIQNLTDQKILFKCLCLSGSGKIINGINFNSIV